MPKEAHVHCRIPGARPGEGLPGLKGVPLLEPTGDALWELGLLGSYFFRCDFGRIEIWSYLASIWLPKAPKVGPKRIRNAIQNRHNNAAEHIMVT